MVGFKANHASDRSNLSLIFLSHPRGAVQKPPFSLRGSKPLIACYSPPLILMSLVAASDIENASVKPLV